MHRCLSAFSGETCGTIGGGEEEEEEGEGEEEEEEEEGEDPAAVDQGLVIGLSVAGAALLLLIVFVVLFSCYVLRNRNAGYPRKAQIPVRAASQASTLRPNPYQSFWSNQQNPTYVIQQNPYEVNWSGV